MTHATMQIFRHASDLARAHGACAFVPTMGALHEGHADLIRRGVELARARALAGGCVVSIFVNPTQFNEQSDYARYPRTLEADAKLCAEAGATIIFAPEAAEVYPPGAPVRVPVLPGVATRPGLEDAHRPGHFAGVCQVVARLFELVRPVAAIFGEKDWQQLAVVRAIVAQERMPVEVVGARTVREVDGLAMSSRNRFLTSEDRVRALAVSRALRACQCASSPAEAERVMRDVLCAVGIEPEYAVVRDAATLEVAGRGVAARDGAGMRALIAARVGSVRLIDNAPWGCGES